jgi:tRNA modification GTPase
LDTALALFFPAPHSFTGEDVLELHVHGGRAVIDAFSEELVTYAGLRQADAGEFSRRAFENGKLDLVEIEGLADLIASETEMQRRLAVEHSTGGLSAIYSAWADRLTRGRALIEAELDFPDEDDVPGSVSDEIWEDMARLALEMEDHLSQGARGEIIRDGFKVVIAGEPNAGKSSLMNALVRREIAIVTEIAGTTRDVLSTDLNIDGFLVRLFDTAGLRETEERVEQEGIRRAKTAIDGADLVLYLEDSALPASEAIMPIGALRIGTKSDLPRKNDRIFDAMISSVDLRGVDDLRALVADQLKSRVQTQSMAIPSRARHRRALSDALAAIRASIAGVDRGLDVRAEDLRMAADALGRVTGRIDVENLLDVIFGEFCIGK